MRARCSLTKLVSGEKVSRLLDTEERYCENLLLRDSYWECRRVRGGRVSARRL